MNRPPPTINATITIRVAITPGEDARLVALQMVEDIRTAFRYTRRAIETMHVEIEPGGHAMTRSR